MDELSKEYRKISIIIGIIILVIIFGISIFFMKIHFDKTKKEVVRYEDKSDLSYKVELKENEYYQYYPYLQYYKYFYFVDESWTLSTFVYYNYYIHLVKTSQ